MAARYEQPDGDVAFAEAAPAPGSKPQAGGLTRDQLLSLVTDPALDEAR